MRPRPCRRSAGRSRRPRRRHGRRCTAIGSQIVAMPTLPMPRSSSRRRITVPSPATPPPGLSQTSAMTSGLGRSPPARSADRCASSSGEHRHRRSARACAKSSRPSVSASASPFGAVVVGDDQHARAHLGHVGRHEAVDDRDRQHAVLARAAPSCGRRRSASARGWSDRRRSCGSRRSRSPADLRRAIASSASSTTCSPRS